MTLGDAKKKLREYFEEACTILEIDFQKIQFSYEKIGERFRTPSNTCETGDNILHINVDWIINILKENFLYDLRYQMYHEARHFYQRMAIIDPSYRVRFGESNENIQIWGFEFSHYHRNEGTIETQKDNAAQFVEIDANAFAIVLLMKHNEPARCPEDQLQQTRLRANEIYEKLKRLRKI